MEVSLKFPRNLKDKETKIVKANADPRYPMLPDEMIWEVTTRVPYAPKKRLQLQNGWDLESGP